jgi:hypothetical protein
MLKVIGKNPGMQIYCPGVQPMRKRPWRITKACDMGNKNACEDQTAQGKILTNGSVFASLYGLKVSVKQIPSSKL